jgi:hypothetical protein
VHFLSSRLTASEWTALIELARSSRMAQVVVHELRRAADQWHTAIPHDVFLTLSAVTGEPSADYLAAASTLDVERLNFLHQATLAGRLSLVAQHLVPGPSYMRARYGPAGPLRLAWHYGRRAVGGGLRWIRDQRRHRRPV